MTCFYIQHRGDAGYLATFVPWGMKVRAIKNRSRFPCCPGTSTGPLGMNRSWTGGMLCHMEGKESHRSHGRGWYFPSCPEANWWAWVGGRIPRWNAGGWLGESLCPETWGRMTSQMWHLCPPAGHCPSPNHGKNRQKWEACSWCPGESVWVATPATAARIDEYLDCGRAGDSEAFPVTPEV